MILDKSFNLLTYVSSFVNWGWDDKTYIRRLQWEISQSKITYVNVFSYKMGKSWWASYLDLLTKHRAFIEDHLERAAYRTSSVDLSGVKLFLSCSSNFFFFFKTGESANAVLHYHKLCSGVSHIWENCRGKHIQSAKPPSWLWYLPCQVNTEFCFDWVPNSEVLKHQKSAERLWNLYNA